MKKLIHGILDFRKNILPEKREAFARLAEVGQTPDVLFITCSDSRVAPNWFASTDPGDLFVVRNVGNLVPPCHQRDWVGSDSSVAAAIEFALSNLLVSDIVVCGHSGCGAIHAVAKGLDKAVPSHLRRWLSFADMSLRRSTIELETGPELSAENRLSQLSVLEQIENLKTYPKITERVEKGNLRLHAWWFDIAQAGVFAFDSQSRRFLIIDEKNANTLLKLN